MSLADVNNPARDRNVLSTGLTETQIAAASAVPGPQGPPGPPGPSGAENFKVITVALNLLGSLNTNTLVYTVPTGKRFVIQDVTYTLNTVVGSTATTLPTVQLFRGTGTGAANQLSNTFNFGGLTFPSPLVAGYWVRTGSSSSTTARGVVLAGEVINCRITIAFVSGGATPYTTLNASCILSGYELDAV
jgi:hypothetical protein